MVQRWLRYVFIVVFLVNSAYAVTSVWNGQVSRDFADANNWSNSEPFINSVMVSASGSNCPILYDGTEIAFGSGRDFFLGGSALGELIMQGGSVSVDDIEIGGDYWVGEGADGDMILNGGIFTANNTYIGTGNNGTLTISSSTFNAGNYLIIGGIGQHNGLTGTGTLVMTSGTLVANHIDMGSGIIGEATLHSGASLEASDITLRNGSIIHFIIDPCSSSSSMVFTSTEQADYIIEGEIDVSFSAAAEEGVYDLITFGTDLSNKNIPQLLSDDANAFGWSLKVVSMPDGGSKLQAIYGVDCEKLVEQGYRVIGDLNSDCDVDFSDFALLANNWLKIGSPEIEYIGGPSISDKQEAIASEDIFYITPDPNIYISTPAITSCPNGRLVANFQVSGDSNAYNQIPEVAAGGRTFIYTSDDHGQTWQHRANADIMHARTFVAGDKIYMFGHYGDLRILESSDWGNTWSDYVELTNNENWTGSATNVWYKDNYIYLAMERYQYNLTDAWPGAELAPILIRGDMNQNLMQSSSWTLSTAGAFIDYVDDQNIQTLFGIPFYPVFYPDRYFFPNAGTRNASPVGWTETNVIQITDPNHYLYDPNQNTFHLFIRTNTGRTNIACIMKAVEYPDGTIRTRHVYAPSERKMLFTPMPGGHMRFHVLYDEETKLYWLLSTQATDSMTKAEYLPDDRFGTPDNERRRMQLHFSKNMFDWVFAGLVAVGPSEKQARHYASMAIDGEDLVILSRSGNENAESAHNGNMVTFHKIKNFRELVY